MPGDGMHGRLLRARIQRRDEGDILRAGNDGDSESDEFVRRRAAFAAKAEDKRSSCGIG